MKVEEKEYLKDYKLRWEMGRERKIDEDMDGFVEVFDSLSKSQTHIYWHQKLSERKIEDLIIAGRWSNACGAIFFTQLLQS